MSTAGIVNKIVNNSQFIRHVDKVLTNDTYAARVLVSTNVVKDIVDCAFNVNQSLNNKKIPENKRKFVAALDLVNGVLMSVSQIGLGFLFSSAKFQDKMCNKLFGNLKNIEPELKLFSKCKTGFTIITSLIVSTVIAKRLIVPFIATPVASWVKDKYLKSDNEGEHSDDKHEYMDKFVYSYPGIAYLGKKHFDD